METGRLLIATFWPNAKALNVLLAIIIYGITCSVNLTSFYPLLKMLIVILTYIISYLYVTFKIKVSLHVRKVNLQENSRLINHCFKNHDK